MIQLFAQMSNPRIVFLVFLLGFHPLMAQFDTSENYRIDQLNLQGGLPEKLLSTRTAGFYHYTLTTKELSEIQMAFQRTGIDAIIYFEMDKLFASNDVTKAFGDYLAKREISNLVFIEKGVEGFRIIVTPFSGKENVIEPKQNAWSTTNRLLPEALKTLYTTAANSQKKQNLLVNDSPETDAMIESIVGKRNEFFASDLKVDPLAIPKTGDEVVDKELEDIFKNNYPLKFTMTEPGVPEKELRRKGQLYVLGFIHARGSVAKEMLGYDMTKSESAILSVTYPEGQQQLKNIPANTPVFKFYFKHIDSGNVFLGTKWDADITWQQALLNHIRGMKAELRIN
ncbi:MAG TPA: hypothetical protein VFZ52_06565 [Chryseolinea sp.]